MDCSIKTRSAVHHCGYCQREIGHLHPPPGPYAADVVTEKKVTNEIAASQKVEEDAGEALEEEGHWKSVYHAEDTSSIFTRFMSCVSFASSIRKTTFAARVAIYFHFFIFTTTCFLPCARRRFRTLRPFAVLLLRRKPCLRTRLRQRNLANIAGVA